MRALRPLLLGFLTVLPLPAVAGEVYIPFVTAFPPSVGNAGNAGDDRPIAPNLNLYNLGSVARRFTVRFLAAGSTGPGELVQTGSLSPQGSTSLTCCEEKSGVLIVSGAPQIAVSAQLVETFDLSLAPAVRTHLPVVTVRDAVPARGSALLQRLLWTPNRGVTSSLEILNFGSRQAHCSVSGFSAAAPAFVDLLSLVVPARGLIAFPNLIGQRIGSPDTGSFSPAPTVTCDQPFYPFAINFYGNVGMDLPSLDIVTPSVVLGNAP